MASVSTITPSIQAPHGSPAWFEECVIRSKTQPMAEFVTVTPTLAAYILKNNDNNRGIKPVKSFQYASDMAGGRWMFNHEPIIISDTGELNDGQHRLSAVIDANVSIPMLLTFGASRESRKTVDQGAARTAADYLSMDGVKNASTAAGLARLVMAYEKSSGVGVGFAKEFSNAQITERVHKDAKIGTSADFAQHCAVYARGLLIPSIIGALHYLFSRVDQSAAEQFLTQVCIGENIKRGDPAFAVRSALQSFERTGKTPRMEIVMRGWVAFRKGRGLTLAKTIGSFPALV